MSDNRPAIFLSYASQDADAARRLCDALRAKGLEVWFDQSELRGGDAWDQSIRKQIKECALFIPIISHNTNAREEGYFRLEWKLAVDRSHLMADDKTFFLPVILDNAPESAARVPDKFRERQWTRIVDDATTLAFANRIATVLKSEPQSPEPATVSADSRPRTAATQGRRTLRRTAILIGAAIALTGVAGLLAWRPWAVKSQAPLGATATASQSTSPEVRGLIKQVEDLIQDPMAATRENYVLADELMQRVVNAEGNVAEHWVLAARVSLSLWEHVYDRSAERKLRTTEQINRALKLSNSSIAARATQALSQSYFGSQEEADRLAHQILAEDSTNRDALQILLLSARPKGRDAEADGYRARLQQRPGGDPFSMLFDTLAFAQRGSLYEAERSLEELIVQSPVRMVYNLKLELLKDYFLDPQGAADFVPKVPKSFVSEDAIAAHIGMAYYLLGRGDEAVTVLKDVQREFLSQYAINLPKGMILGLAHEVAGQPAAAAQAWRTALAVVEKRLETDGSDLRLLNHKMQLHAMLGQKAAALETLKLRIEVGGKDNVPAAGFSVRVLVRIGKLAEAVDMLQQQWGDLSFQRRANLMRDLVYLPEYQAFRKDKRVAALIAEHREFVERARKAPGARQ